jgi:hypothetical protein
LNLQTQTLSFRTRATLKNLICTNETLHLLLIPIARHVITRSRQFFNLAVFHVLLSHAITLISSAVFPCTRPLQLLLSITSDTTQMCFFVTICHLITCNCDMETERERKNSSTKMIYGTYTQFISRKCMVLSAMRIVHYRNQLSRRHCSVSHSFFIISPLFIIQKGEKNNMLLKAPTIKYLLHTTFALFHGAKGPPFVMVSRNKKRL